MINLDTVTKQEEIGKGMLGTVYLATDNKNNKYAIKIEQILEKDIKKSYKSSVWREVEFVNKMSKLYPNHFMKLYDHRIEDNCKHKQSWKSLDIKLADIPLKYREKYKKLQKSKYCSVKLYSYVDTTLDKVMWSNEHFNYNMYYDLFIQVIYVIFLMNKHGYLHNDLHSKNIGVVYTNKKFVNIFGHKIPTHGMFIQAIDYGFVLHKKYDLTAREKVKLENEMDLFPVINSLVISYGSFWDNYKKYLKDIDNKTASLKLNKNDKDMLFPFIEHLDLSRENENFLLRSLFILLCYENYEKYLMGNKLKEVYPPIYMIPINVSLFIISNIYNVEKIIKYVIDNRI